MEYVLLAYGAVFVCTGFVLGVQARAAAPSEPISRAGLWAATLFALVHGASDWLELGVYLGVRQHGVAPSGPGLARIALLALSFALLGCFGLLLATRRDGTPRWRLALAVPGGALLAVAPVAWLALGAGRAPLDDAGLAAAEGVIRYGLGVPACAAASVGLVLVWRRIRDEHWRAARYLAAAAVALAAYGFFAGVVVPPSLAGPAATLNVASFAAVTHVPVELFRAAAMAAVGLLLSEVFVRTTTEHLRSEVEHLRDGFISLVAHDLRTPLGTVTNAVTLLERLPPGEHGTEREARVLRALGASARAMTKIVSDLLDASRLESRKLSISPEALDLVPLLLRLVEWAPAEAMRGHAVRLVPPGPLPPVVADPVRVEQVLSNLLSNAGKYSPPGTEILLEARAGPREVTLSVMNGGDGIAAADLPRVFSRHFRTPSARTGRAPGLGLGLYIARGLVESQGGRMWAESEPGVRTTFSFTLPRARARQPAPGRDAMPLAPGARLPL
jgi:signal transduction histidine kinase